MSGENTIVLENDAKFITEPDLGDIERYKYENPLKYDVITLAKRKLEVNNLMKDYPHLSRQRLEDIWDYFYIVGEDKIKENLENGYYNQKFVDRSNEKEACLTVRDI